MFENLLAEYNPETETTARKQTGSFYTPREIVNYMVDESLIAYLANSLLNESTGFIELGSSQPNLFGNDYNQGQLSLQTPIDASPYQGKEEALNNKLRHLLSYNNKEHQFNDKEVDKLINAIDNVKIIDIACGSGAFPMGILQKLVFILGKLDPNNSKWKQQQKEKAIQPVLKDIRVAKQISYEEAREEAIQKLEERLTEIEDDFDNNEMDYPRKLFLIENCIFGVDIQPIAVQISKLRFFISLIVDQKVNNNQPNRGILPLPNLETKFVAANSLIGISKPQKAQLELDLRSQDIKQKEEQLKAVRNRHFKARTPQTKKKCREEDKQLRQELGELLKQQGLADDIALKLSEWDLYNQNLSANFFDPAWMFGVSSFDICIGNPPYGAFMEKWQKDYFNKHYKHQDYQIDSYLLFLEKAYELLKKAGILSYIVSNTWLTSVTYIKIRKYLTNYYKWLKFLYMGDSVFKAVVDTHSWIFQKTTKLKNNPKNSLFIDKFENNKIYFSHDVSWSFIPCDGKTINIVGEDSHQKLYHKIIDKSESLKKVCSIFNGVKPFEKGKGKPPQDAQIMKEKPYVFEGDYPGNQWKPLLRGSLINRYVNLWDKNYWILYGEWLAAPRKPFIFQAPEKICVRQTGDSIIATIINQKFIARDNLHIILRPKEKYDLKFILGVLNSKLIDFIYSHINPEKGETLAQVKKKHLEQLPLPKISDKNPELIIELVDKILENKRQNPNADTTELEREIDEIVYELYGLNEEEIAIIEESVKGK